MATPLYYSRDATSIANATMYLSILVAVLDVYTQACRYHSHVTYYTEVRRILLLMAWLLASTHTLALPNS